MKRFLKKATDLALIGGLCVMVGLMGWQAAFTDGGMKALLVAKAYAQSAMNLINPVLTGHVEASPEAGRLPPTVANATCNGGGGTAPSVTAGSTDSMGQVTTGTKNQGVCTITFNRAWTLAPICNVVDQTGNSIGIAFTTSTTAITVSSGLQGGDKLNYWCVGHR